MYSFYRGHNRIKLTLNIFYSNKKTPVKIGFDSKFQYHINKINISAINILLLLHYNIHKTLLNDT